MPPRRKQLEPLRQLAERYGRDIEMRRSGHYALVCKFGHRPMVITSQTPSDRRALKNIESDLRRNDKPREMERS